MLSERPVVAYKRRKFFKSRGAPEQEPSATSVPDTTSATSNKSLTTSIDSEADNNKHGYNSNKRPVSDFDSLFTSGNNSTSQHKALTTISLPPTLPPERSPSPVTYNDAAYSSMSSTTATKSSTGIKLKIFKSRNVEKTSWSQGQYSSKVELPSDDSKSSSSSSSAASSPSSIDVNDLEKDSVISSRHDINVHTNKISGHHQPPSISNRIGSTTLISDNTLLSEQCYPSYSSYSVNTSSPIHRSSRSPPSAAPASHLPSSSPYDSSETAANSLNSTLDSSAEFGEITDQRTGLPVSMLSDVSSLMPESSSLSRLGSSQSTGIKDVPPSSVTQIKNTYTKNVTKSKELNKYLNKNSESLSKDSSVDRIKLPDAVPSTSLNKSTNHISPVSSVDSYDSLEKITRTSSRSYGSKSSNKIKTPASNTFSIDIDKRNNSLDVRNNSTYSHSIDRPKPSTSNSHDLTTLRTDVYSVVNNASDTVANTLLCTNNYSTKSSVPDLFSSGFDEEEIIDRTLVDYGSPSLDSGAESNGPLEGVEGSSASNETYNNSQSATGRSSDRTYSRPSIASTSSSVNGTGTYGSKPIPRLAGETTSVDNDATMLKKSRSLPVRSSLLRPLAANTSTHDELPTTNTTIASGGMTRKRSIFKSRVVQEDGNKKRATYNHKWHSTNEEKEEHDSFRSKSKPGAGSGSNVSSAQSSGSTAFDDFDFDGKSSSLQRVQSWSAGEGSSVLMDFSEDDSAAQGSTVTSVKCNKAAKQVRQSTCIYFVCIYTNYICPQ